MREPDEAEDLFICRRLRSMLENKYNCRFADEATANRFSYEIVSSGEPTFGFHGLFHLPIIYRNNPEFLVGNLPVRALKNQLKFILYGVNQFDPLLQQRFMQLITSRNSEIESVNDVEAQLTNCTE